MGDLSDRTKARVQAILDNTTLSATQRRDLIYAVCVEVSGLQGQAFFGHRRTPAQARRLVYLWSLAQKFVPIMEKRAAEAIEASPVESTPPVEPDEEAKA